jgi:hypothetical protein
MIPGRALVLAALLGLAGCSAFEPYPTVPPAARPGEAASAPRVAICYDALRSSRAEVRARAQQECPADTTARFVATDLRMNHCPILLPRRASFVCAPGR